MHLAIVIPAYRAAHLGAALDSLARQTNRAFRVYVGDDASTEDLGGIVREFADRLDLVYVRFDQNLGRTDLIEQWNRCIALSREPWVWLFSDDDLADPDCVAVFLRQLAEVTEPPALFRFNTRTIDGEGQWICDRAPHPARETAAELMRAVVRQDGRFWGAPDHLFNRAEWKKVGGFEKFPAAMCSDLATWLRLAEVRGVVTLAGARVSWRRHPTGISSGNPSFRRQAIAAQIAYVAWLRTWNRQHHAAGRLWLWCYTLMGFYMHARGWGPDLESEEREMVAEGAWRLWRIPRWLHCAILNRDRFYRLPFMGPFLRRLRPVN